MAAAAAAAPGPSSAALASETARASSSLLDDFHAFRAELDAHHDRNERLIRFSRDVTADSKKLIFLLQRYNPCLDQVAVQAQAPACRSATAIVHPSNVKLLQQAGKKAEEITRLVVTVAEQERLRARDVAPAMDAAQTADSAAVLNVDRYERAFGQGLEEYIEGISFLHYLQHGSIISLVQLQDRIRKLTPSESIFEIPVRRYLLGLCDLSGELMRHATNAVGLGGTAPAEAAAGYAYIAPDAVVASVLATIRTLYAQLDGFAPFIARGELNKKQSVTDQSARKIEHLLYGIKVREREYAAYAAANPAAKGEMLRRALLSANQAPSFSAPSAGGESGHKRQRRDDGDAYTSD